MIRAIGMALLFAGALMGTGCQTGSTDFGVTFTKVGGFMPFNDTLTVSGDGSLTLTDRSHATKTGKVDPKDLERLRGLLKSPEFQGAAAAYRNDRGADLVTHTIDAKFGSSHKTVMVMTATEHPKVLDDIIAELERLEGRTK